MEAIVLAGGLGTRLSHLLPDVPKVMADVAGKPFLAYPLAHLAGMGVTRAVLAVGYRQETVSAYFGNAYKGMELLYSREDAPLYTGGAIKRALSLCQGREVFVINGDTFFDVPLKAMRDDFRAGGAGISVAVKEMRDFGRYGTVSFSEGMAISGFHEKAPRKEGYINGGVYLLAPGVLSGYPDRFSFEKEVLETDFRKHAARAFPCDGYFIDIGVPEDYAKARNDFAKGS